MTRPHPAVRDAHLSRTTSRRGDGDVGAATTAAATRPVAPSRNEWNQLRSLMIDLYENRGQTVSEINQRMRAKGYLTTPRMIWNRLKAWGASKYQSAEEKDELCRRLLEDYQLRRPPQRMHMRQIKKLQRHLKEKEEPSGKDETVLRILREMEPLALADSNSDDEPSPSQQLSHADEEDAGSQILSATTVGFEAGRAEWFSGDGGLIIAHELVVQGEEFLFPDTPGPTAASLSTPSSPTMLVRQPAYANDRLMNIEKLFHLGQGYYLSKLQDRHLLFRQQQLHTGSNTTTAVTPQANTLMATDLTNSLFWTKVKNGFYWLKVRSRHLAAPELRAAFEMIPALCESQPLPLLKDVYATLAPVATSIDPGLRMQFLREFRRSAVLQLGRGHALAEICRILCAEGEEDEVEKEGEQEGTVKGKERERRSQVEMGTADELAVRGLQAMLNASSPPDGGLPPDDPDLFELRRTLARLHRRLGNLATAEAQAASLVAAAEATFGAGHVNTRLALSESVYVLSAQDRHAEALDRARDVLARARQLHYQQRQQQQQQQEEEEQEKQLLERYEPTNGGGDLDSPPEEEYRPDGRTIYAMEDAAEICERLGRHDEAVELLRGALRAAIRLWGDHGSTTHILEKLEGAQDRRHRAVTAMGVGG